MRVSVVDKAHVSPIGEQAFGNCSNNYSFWASCITVWGGSARDERMAEAQGGRRQKLVSRTGQLESKGRAFIGRGSRERLRARVGSNQGEIGCDL